MGLRKECGKTDNEEEEIQSTRRKPDPPLNRCRIQGIMYALRFKTKILNSFLWRRGGGGWLVEMAIIWEKTPHVCVWLNELQKQNDREKIKQERFRKLLNY